MLKRTKVIVLHRIPYSDSSLIVKGFSDNFGVLSFLVKSARKKNSPFQGALDPLAESEIVFNDSGRSDLHFIRETSLVEWFPRLRKDLERSAMASVMAEVLLRYMPAGLSQEFEFRYTEKALQVLDRGPNPQDALARWLWHMMDISGYALSLTECVRCGSSLSETPADFHFESGGAICRSCLGSFEPKYDSVFLSDIARLHTKDPLIDPQTLEREFFKYLKTHLGENREIKSYHWLQEVRSYAFRNTDP